MISVFICEDDLLQRERLKKIIENYIMIENLDMELVMATENPLHILEYLRNNPKTTGLYFLDVELQHDMNGIALGSEIREIDDFGKIIFVTTHGELAYLTFMYRVEAMDYIIKDRPEDIQRKVQECIQVANRRHLNDKNPEKKFYQVKVGDKIRAIPYEEIMFFESSTVPHKLILHMDNSQLEFYGSIKEVAEIGSDFYRCHKSFVVNIKNVLNVDKTQKEVEVVNGEFCLVSVRGMKGLIQAIESNN